MSNALSLYIAEKNAKTLAWVAEAPESRWACTLVEDAAHWLSYGIETPEQLEKYLVACDVYETTKSVWGYKPSWAHLMTLSLAELQADAARLSEQAAQKQAEDDEDEARFLAWEASEREAQAQAEARAFQREEWTLGMAFAGLAI